MCYHIITIVDQFVHMFIFDAFNGRKRCNKQLNYRHTANFAKYWTDRSDGLWSSLFFTLLKAISEM